MNCPVCHRELSGAVVRTYGFNYICRSGCGVLDVKVGDGGVSFMFFGEGDKNPRRVNVGFALMVWDELAL